MRNSLSPAVFRMAEDGRRFSIALPGFDISDCSAFVRCDDVEEPCAWSCIEQAGDMSCYRADTASGRWQLTVRPADNGAGVAGLELMLLGELTRVVAKLELVSLHVPSLPSDHVLEHGRQMGGCSLIRLPKAQAATFSSSFQHLVTRNGITLQLAQSLLQREHAEICGRVEAEAVRALAAITPMCDAGPGPVQAEPLSLFADADGHGLMRAWGLANRESEKPPLPPMCGWNSWDYYRWTITEDEVLRNAEFIAADPVLRRHISRIVIDDGWQYCYGEWEANPLFPHGMAWLAKRLTDMGFEPGLWFAPTIFEPHSRVAQLDQELLARGESGLPCLAFETMRRFGFVMDPTVPRAQDWLRALFSRYVEMGYRYFKLDFMGQTLKARRFADPTIPRGAIPRLIVEQIRAAVGDRARIMGCNYYFNGGTAFVDEVRTSSDIHVMWEMVREHVASIAARFWSQGVLWGNDPDFAICRGDDTADDPALRRLKPCHVFITPEMSDAGWFDSALVDLRLEQARVLLSLVLISGGAVNLSDNLCRLNEAGLDLVRRTVAALRGQAGVPLDLFSAELPERWVQPLPDGNARALLINWTDAAREMTLDLAAAGLNPRTAINFWTDEPVPVACGRISRVLPGRSCIFAELHS